jgi:hypothetical protein
VINQRSKKRAGTLKKWQDKELTKVDFIFNPDEYTWETKLQELQSFKEQYGHLKIPQKGNQKLSSWITIQRSSRKDGKLDTERIRRLDRLGFVWDPADELWNDRFQDLVTYRKVHGHCLVSRAWHDKKLFNWVYTVRLLKKNGKLHSEKIIALEGLGFVWDPLQEAWQEKYGELVAYKKQYGNCLVPNKCPLGVWVGHQRTLRKKGKLDEAKREKLDGLSFIWDPLLQKWEDEFKKLVTYQEKYGDCLVRRSWHDKRLSTWVDNQRQAKRKNKLDPERIKRLDEIGFVWEATKIITPKLIKI